MPKIKFSKTCEVKIPDEVSDFYRADETYELNAESADRWLRRGVAAEAKGSAKAHKAPHKSAVAEKKSKGKGDE